MQPEDGHYHAPKHVVVPYVENTSYPTNKYSCVRPVHTLYNGDDEPHDYYTTVFVVRKLPSYTRGTLFCDVTTLSAKNGV